MIAKPSCDNSTATQLAIRPRGQERRRYSIAGVNSSGVAASLDLIEEHNVGTLWSKGDSPGTVVGDVLPQILPLQSGH